MNSLVGGGNKETQEAKQKPIQRKVTVRTKEKNDFKTDLIKGQK